MHTAQTLLFAAFIFAGLASIGAFILDAITPKSPDKEA